MNKIIAFFNMNKNTPGGWIDTNKKYMRFYFEGNKVIYGESRNKSDFKDYNHFVGVMGKFNPYQMFIKKPLVISELTLDNFRDVYKRFKLKYPGYPE